MRVYNIFGKNMRTYNPIMMPVYSWQLAKTIDEVQIYIYFSLVAMAFRVISAITHRNL